MDTEFKPKGWHSAVRAIFNGIFDAREAIRRNNPGMSDEVIAHWTKVAINRGTEKAEKSGMLEDR